MGQIKGDLYYTDPTTVGLDVCFSYKEHISMIITDWYGNNRRSYEIEVSTAT